MSLLGPQGLRATALKSHQNTQALLALLKEIKVAAVFNSSYFHECVIRIPNAIEVVTRCAEQGVLIGLCLEPYYAELKDCILVCVTETKTDEDLRAYCAQIKE